jgi:hypothetical protein
MDLRDDAIHRAASPADIAMAQIRYPVSSISDWNWCRLPEQAWRVTGATGA